MTFLNHDFRIRQRQNSMGHEKLSLKNQSQANKITVLSVLCIVYINLFLEYLIEEIKVWKNVK